MDRDKVVKGLESCFVGKNCDECPYSEELHAILNGKHGEDWHCPILDDALALLKEQEAMLRKEYERGYKNGRADEAGLRDGTIMQTFNPD